MRTRALAAVALAAVACGPREPAPAPPPSAGAPATVAPAPTTTTTTTTLPPPVWRTVRWGMSREEVLAALPGEARRLAKPETYGQPPASTDVAIPEMAAGAARYRVLLGFGTGTLDRIHLVAAKPTYDTCGEVERELAAAHGAPASRREIVSSVPGHAVVWTLPAETITLACTEKASLGFRSVTIDHAPPAAPSPAA